MGRGQYVNHTPCEQKQGIERNLKFAAHAAEEDARARRRRVWASEIQPDVGILQVDVKARSHPVFERCHPELILVVHLLRVEYVDRMKLSVRGVIGVLPRSGCYVPIL